MGDQGTRRRRFASGLTVLAVLLAACAGGEVVEETSTSPSTTTGSSPTSTVAPTTTTTTVTLASEPFCTEPLPGELVVADTSSLEDPDTGPDSWPEDGAYNRWSTRDGPETAYRPCFVPAGESDLDEDTVVIGIAVGDDARAYALDQLVAHYVNDRFGDDPLLVSY